MNRVGSAACAFLLLIVAESAIGGADPPKDQIDALANLTAQQWLEAAANATNADRRIAENHRRLLERPDVKSAIAKYGRVGSFPVYRMQ